MKAKRTRVVAVTGCGCLLLLGIAGCKAKGEDPPTVSGPPFMSTVTAAQPQIADEPPEPGKTEGFDGKKAFDHVAKQVSFGPRPSGSQAILQLQNYLQSELKSYGCTMEIDAFNADTPAGRVPMKNLLVKIPGEKPEVILLATHYDTKLLENFVGADDGGSSTAVMLELARLLCAQRGRYAVWIAFFDGEEAVKEWTDTDSRYGSRQMAAKLSISGDLSKIRAFLLADIVGSRALRLKRDTSSTKALTDLMWSTAAKLGYSGIFVSDATEIFDDHDSFLKRNVPSVDVIDLEIPYWHTPQDTLDKISAKSLAIVGHVFLESVKSLQAKW
jgi:glutaminyl-peptide cyclotransferase